MIIYPAIDLKGGHVVDLDGAFSGEPGNIPAIKKIVGCGLKIQLGGGLRTEAAIKEALELGVSRVVIGTRAAQDTVFVEQMVKQFGDRIAVGIDARDGKVAVKGWVDVTDTTAMELAQWVSQLGVKTIIYTDISRDGMLSGPNFAAQQNLLATISADIIASGGVSSPDDIEKFYALAKTHSNLNGVIIGKALYDKRIDLAEVLRSL